MTWPDRALVTLGGALGAALRVTLVEGMATAPATTTLAVNVLGALLLGVLVAAVARYQARLLLGTGLLGGFTTFSALAVQAAGAADPATGLLLGGASVTLGLLAALAGLRLGAVLARRSVLG